MSEKCHERSFESGSVCLFFAVAVSLQRCNRLDNEAKTAAGITNISHVHTSTPSALARKNKRRLISRDLATPTPARAAEVDADMPRIREEKATHGAGSCRHCCPGS